MAHILHCETRCFCVSIQARKGGGAAAGVTDLAFRSYHGRTDTDSFIIEGRSGDIYVVAHAVTCCFAQ